MIKTYTLNTDDGASVTYGSKKAAVANGEKSGQPYEVLSPTGQVVASKTLDENVAEPTPEPEPAKTFNLDEMKDKIAKLLAKAEGTDNQAERDAFTEKAERLMLKLGIEAAELEAAGTVKAEPIIEQRLVFSDSYAKAMVQFTEHVAAGFGNLTTLRLSVAQRQQISYVIGHKSDVETFCQLMNSLNMQAYTALREFRETNAERVHVDKQHKFVMDRSFLSAYGRTVGVRLLHLRETEVATASTGAALVLASKKDRVNDKVAEMYPELKKSRATKLAYSRIGTEAGRLAGQTAKLGQDELDGQREGIQS